MRPLFIWSISRPGVAISTSYGADNWRFWMVYDSPPVTQTVEKRGNWREKLCDALATCCASSRVGVSTRIRGPRPRRDSVVVTFTNAGSKNAAVLPVPVGAEAIRSRPASSSGMVLTCTGVGWVMPRWDSEVTKGAPRPRSANDGPLWPVWAGPAIAAGFVEGECVAGECAGGESVKGTSEKCKSDECAASVAEDMQNSSSTPGDFSRSVASRHACATTEND